jgi:hypothetical protein
MSLLVSCFLKDGIILGSDSRTTYKTETSIRYTDFTYKSVLMDGKIGIAHCLNASVNGRTVNDHLQDFMKKYKGRGLTRIPALLKDYFLNLNPKYKIEFLVCGYINEVAHGYRVETQVGIEKLTTNPLNVYWAGERDVPSRLFSTTYFKRDGKYLSHSYHPLKLSEFSIPDGIDFVEFLINTSKNVMSWQECDQTIGGPIDILIIKPYEAYWYRRK